MALRNDEDNQDQHWTLKVWDVDISFSALIVVQGQAVS